MRNCSHMIWWANALPNQKTMLSVLGTRLFSPIDQRMSKHLFYIGNVQLPGSWTQRHIFCLFCLLFLLLLFSASRPIFSVLITFVCISLIYFLNCCFSLIKEYTTHVHVLRVSRKQCSSDLIFNE